MLYDCCVVILVVGIIFDYVFMKHCLYLKKKAVKIGAPKFWPSYHYSSVVRTQLESAKIIEIGAVVHEIL